MGYKIKYSKKEKKKNKQDKKDKEILNLIPLSSDCWIDAREDNYNDDYVLI
jgi:hypothetical protein